jgi:DNA-binding MurR/RpiR family transcriptional regulator
MARHQAGSTGARRRAPVLKAPVAATIARAYPALSESHRRTADFVLARPLDAATMTIDELAHSANISIATANRFAKALGFRKYAEFRAELVANVKATMAPVERLRLGQREAASAGSVVADAMEEDLDNIQKTLHGLSAEACDRAVSLILDARRIYTLGFGVSTYIASFAANGLLPFCQDVRFLAAEGGGEQAIRRMLAIGAEDVLIAIAVPRYSRETVEIAGMARKRGATVIAITDGPKSPLNAVANLTLYAFAARRLLSSSAAAAFTLVEALISATAHQREDSLKSFTDLSEQVGHYLHGDLPRAYPHGE